jgi:hypothetical protein
VESIEQETPFHRAPLGGQGGDCGKEKQFF